MLDKLKENFDNLSTGEKIIGGIATGAAFLISAPLTIAAGVGYLAKVYNDEKEKSTIRPLNEKEDIKTINNNIINELNSVNTPFTLAQENLYEEDVPKYYICPLTKNIMKVPVITPYGNSYEKSAIENWLIDKNFDPISKKPLKKEQLVINYSLKNIIEEYLREKQEIFYDINQNYSDYEK